MVMLNISMSIYLGFDKQAALTISPWTKSADKNLEKSLFCKFVLLDCLFVLVFF